MLGAGRIEHQPEWNLEEQQYHGPQPHPSDCEDNLRHGDGEVWNDSQVCRMPRDRDQRNR